MAKHYRPVDSLGTAVLRALSAGTPMTVRQVHTEAMVYIWDIDLSMSAVASRLMLLTEQGLVTKTVNANGATQYTINVNLVFKS